MMTTMRFLLLTVRSLFRTRSGLLLENLALRQQLAVMKNSIKRPRFRRRDRLFWITLSRLWEGWKSPLVVVKPATVIAWHRKGFRLFWKLKSRTRRPGRPRVSKEIRDLVRRMVEANPTWGAPRIHGELRKLGIDVSERTVSNLMPRRTKPPSQTWRTFLKNHMDVTCAIDFFTVPTASFRILFVLVVMKHSRREIVHFNVTEHPCAEWTAQQIVEAFPWQSAPRYLLRDRDKIFAPHFRKRVKGMQIEEVITARKSPWQNPYLERFIGSVRADCLNRMIILNERHLKRIISGYLDYYHQDRTHLGLEKDTPATRTVYERATGSAKVIAFPRIGGLHHRYEWSKAA